MQHDGREVGQRRKFRQHLATALGVGIQPVAFKFADDPGVLAGGGDAAIVQQSRFEHLTLLGPIQAQPPTDLDRHDAHPAAMKHIVHANQINRASEGLHHVMNADLHGNLQCTEGKGTTVGRNAHATP